MNYQPDDRRNLCNMFDFADHSDALEICMCLIHGKLYYTVKKNVILTVQLCKNATVKTLLLC